MTYEEALEITQKSLEEGRMILEALSYGYLYAVKEALEKQVPLKPYKNRTEYYCAACADNGEKTCVGKNHSQGNKTRKDYCFNCGQAQDWSDDT